MCVWFLGALEKFCKLSISSIFSVRLFVCPSAWNISHPT